MRIFFVAYLFTLLGLLVYSYSQIDLNLTLSSNSTYQYIQQQLITLGYFNRPFSAAIFVSLLLLLFICYGYFLYLVHKKRIREKQVWVTIGLTVALTLFAYPAFSHDFFNYLFDTRILVHYGQNPYVHKALDFPDDLWVRFMHWTHRTYPYGPLWIATTVPFYLLGFGKLTLTMISYKLLFAATYIGNIYFIKKITKNMWPIVFFALNPLIIIESLVSPHLDGFMLLFLLMGMYLFTQKKKWQSIVLVIFSAGIKFVTGALLPLFLFFDSKSLRSPGLLINWLAWLFLATLMIPIYQREPYPWYFIPFIGLVSLSDSFILKTIVLGISVGTLLAYAPFLYFGDYSQTVVTMKIWLTAVPLFILICIVLTFELRKRLFL